MPRRKTKLQADNLVQGVSQQVETKQTLNHCRDRQNIDGSIIHGNTKRPSLWFDDQLNIPPRTDQAEHFYHRDLTEQYLIIAREDNLQVFDRLTNQEIPVTAPQGFGYLNSPNSPSKDLCFLTLGDYTLVCNKTVTVQMTGVTTSEYRHQALLYVTQGDYGTTYKVTINGVERASVTTSDTDVDQTSTVWIAQQIKDQLRANLPSGTYIVNGTGSVLYITVSAGLDFDITATDSIGNDAIRTVKEQIQRFEDLPERAPHNYVVRVSQSVGRDEDDFFVRFVADDPLSTESRGVWVETISPGVEFEIAKSTMPYFLVREANGTFTFRQGDWEDRVLGDDKTVPKASFIGQKINHMFFFQNRLGFLSRGNLITSRTASYFNFWRRSARTKIDSDPIDIAATTSKVLELHYAFPFDQRLVVFSDEAQLISEGGSSYTPANASLEVASEYECDVRTAPISVGTSIFFTVKKGRYSAVMEMQRVDNADARLFADEITEHVPHYLPEGRFKLCASSRSPSKLVLIKPGGTRVWTYHWLNAQRDRVVSSWSHYEISSGYPVWAGVFLENKLELLAQHPTGNVRGSLTFDENGQYLGTLEDFHLDFMNRATLEWQGNQTIARVRFADDGQDNFVTLAKKNDGTVRAIQGDIVSVSTQGEYKVLVLNGLWDEVIVGEVFSSHHDFSQPYPKKYGPRGEIVANESERFQIDHLRLNITDTGPFDVYVDKLHRDTRKETFTGLSIGSQPSTVNGPPISSGSFKVSVKGQTQDSFLRLVSDNWYPLCFTSGEWKGTLIRKL